MKTTDPLRTVVSFAGRLSGALQDQDLPGVTIRWMQLRDALSALPSPLPGTPGVSIDGLHVAVYDVLAISRIREAHAAVGKAFGFDRLTHGGGEVEIPDAWTIDPSWAALDTSLRRLQERLEVLDAIAGGEHAKSSRSTQHSPDFTGVTWHGPKYHFTKTQARAVEILWRAWETGSPAVRGQSIVSELDLGSTRTLSQVFRLRSGKHHEAWGTLIIPVKGIKGAYCLNDPNDPALQIAQEERAKRTGKRTGTRKK